jgi:hypothetical protein
VTAVVKFSNLEPFVFGNIIDFTFTRGVVRILASDSVDVVFSFVLESSMEVGQLVTTLTVSHWCSSFNFISLFVQK